MFNENELPHEIKYSCDVLLLVWFHFLLIFMVWVGEQWEHTLNIHVTIRFENIILQNTLILRVFNPNSWNETGNLSETKPSWNSTFRCGKHSRVWFLFFYIDFFFLSNSGSESGASERRERERKGSEWNTAEILSGKKHLKKNLLGDCE